MFDEEFGGLPEPIERALRERLEEIVRMIDRRASASIRDYSVNAYNKEQINALIHGVFDLANRLKLSMTDHADLPPL